MRITAKQGWTLSLCLCLAVPVLAACSSSGVRLRAQFDDQFDPTRAGQPAGGGVVPSATPAPNPPADSFTWGTQFVTARVVGSGGAGAAGRVRVEPNAAYSGTGRATVLLARSEPLSQDRRNTVRGGLLVDMRGDGHLVVGIPAGGPGAPSAPLGGFHISHPGIIPSIAYLNSANLRALAINPSLADGVGTYLGPFPIGQDVDLRWSIDQESRTLSLGAYSASGVFVGPVTFDATAPDGTPNTPIRTIWLDVAFYKVSRDTVALLDNFLVEEVR